jgi:hypothetical protein
VLEKELSVPSGTGFMSRLAAEVTPGALTEATGIGAAAKGRQATIDRVKQVIGKTLEGGVLRKEDEAKYAKILPTIGDPPEVAKKKLDGLRSALERKREITLENLKAAGRDTSRIGATGGRAPQKVGRFTVEVE